MTLFRSSLFIFLLICLGCSAQSVPTPKQRENHRAPGERILQIPSDVQVTVVPLKPSDFPNYDAVKITFTRALQEGVRLFTVQGRQDSDQLTKMDLTKDPNAEVMKKIDVRGVRARKQGRQSSRSEL